MTDSRKLNDHLNALFFALKGRRNGHDFIPDVYKKGVRNFVISDSDFSANNFIDANFFLVKDTLSALQVLAETHRLKFEYPVIGYDTFLLKILMTKKPRQNTKKLSSVCVFHSNNGFHC